MKKLIITIDTEGDNQWEWKPGKKITTENSRYLERFQRLCDRYNFKPTWLTNYEMLMDDYYLKFISKVISEGHGEAGLHIHGWNNPPDYNLKNETGEAPYLIEYPIEIMEEKIASMIDVFKNKLGVAPVSHRAGRWAMDERYFDLLIKYGIGVDCSVTPGVNWQLCKGAGKNFGGTNYIGYPSKPYMVDSTRGEGSVLEVPVSIFHTHRLNIPDKLSLKNILKAVYHGIKGENIWLRPHQGNTESMLMMIDKMECTDADYIMFMIHSSELMPGGSPNFPTTESIESLYNVLEKLWERLSGSYEGITLADYAQSKCI